MKRLINLLLIAVIIGSNLFAQQKEEKPKLNSKKEKLSYTIGVDFGKNIKQQKIDLDTKYIFEGMNNAMSDAKFLLTEDEMIEVMRTFQQEMVEGQQKLVDELKTKNLEEGRQFLTKNALKDGIKVLPSGLQYKIIVNGKGKKPSATDTVIAHYKGTLIDGSVFESTYDKNDPAEFPLNVLIKGWSEALQLMSEGSKWQLFIPANLGWGEKGTGQFIGPNSTVIFEVELLKIK